MTRGNWITALSVVGAVEWALLPDHWLAFCGLLVTGVLGVVVWDAERQS